MTSADGAVVRVAADGDFLPAMRVLEGALLAVDAGRVRAAVDRGDALVAARDGWVVGALVATDPADADVSGGPPAADRHVAAVAVRRPDRREGIGRALIEAASDRWGRLSAAFDPRARPFYAALGFRIERRGDRLLGVREG